MNYKKKTLKKKKNYDGIKKMKKPNKAKIHVKSKKSRNEIKKKST